VPMGVVVMAKYALEWVVEGFIPLGDRCMDVAIEGGFKTTFGCYLSTHIAAGKPVFENYEVKQGPVLIVDNETPRPSLYNKLNRFSQHLGYSNFEELPITVYGEEFFFSRPASLSKLKAVVRSVRPIFIRFDSLIAMLPKGRQGLDENSSESGKEVGQDFKELIDEFNCSILLAAHAKKPAELLSLDETIETHIVNIIRGHGGIIGEGCDTGYVLKIISERDPTRFAIIPKPRRTPLPLKDKAILIDLKEEAYGKGPADLVIIPPEMMPPSEIARTIYQHLKAKSELDDADSDAVVSSRMLKNTLAYSTAKEVKGGLGELIRRGVLRYHAHNDGYSIRHDLKKVTREYLIALDKVDKESHTEGIVK